MEDFLALQLRAIDALSKGEKNIEYLSDLITTHLIPEEHKVHGGKILESLISTCIKYGELKSTHEKYLADGTQKP